MSSLLKSPCQNPSFATTGSSSSNSRCHTSLPTLRSRVLSSPKVVCESAHGVDFGEVFIGQQCSNNRSTNSNQRVEVIFVNRIPAGMHNRRPNTVKSLHLTLNLA